MKTTCLYALMILAFGLAIPARAQVPQVLSYQGRVAVGSTNFDNTGLFQFALVNGVGDTAYWSNDGSLSLTPGALTPTSPPPTKAVSLAVSKGLYSVLLGDTNLPNMTVIPAGVFTNADVRLRVWFSDGTHGSQLLTPDQRIAAVGYAIVAGSVADGAIGSNQLSANAVQAANLADGAVSIQKLLPRTLSTAATAGNIAVASIPGNLVFTTTSTTRQDTGLRVSLVTTGRPVLVCLVLDPATGPAFWNYAGQTGSKSCNMYVRRDDIEIGSFAMRADSTLLTLPGTGVLALDVPAAGNHTYKIQMAVEGTTTLAYVRLVAFEL